MQHLIMKSGYANMQKHVPMFRFNFQFHYTHLQVSMTCSNWPNADAVFP